MNIKKRPALFFVLTAFTVIVCRCGSGIGPLIDPIRLADGSIIGSCESKQDVSELTEVAGTQVAVFTPVWECSLTCPDNSEVKFDMFTKPPFDLPVAEKEAFLSQYCSAEAMSAATETLTAPIEAPSDTPEPTDTLVPTLTTTPELVTVEVSLQPVLAGSVTVCDTGLGYINFPLANPVPDLTGKSVSVLLNGDKVSCALAGSNSQVLGCSLPAGTSFPLKVSAAIDGTEVNNFSFDGNICIHTTAAKEEESAEEEVLPPTAPPIDCDVNPDPYQC